MIKIGLCGFERITITTLLAIGCCMICNAAYAEPIFSAELINGAKQNDGKTIIYEGEVIGDIMIRGQYAWVNINDGQNAIGIWTAKALIKDITYKGSYGFKGDVIEITGVFHRACPEHGGDLDIHAQSIRKISSGMQISKSVRPHKIKLALTLLGIALLLFVFDLVTRKRIPPR